MTAGSQVTMEVALGGVLGVAGISKAFGRLPARVVVVPARQRGESLLSVRRWCWRLIGCGEAALALAVVFVQTTPVHFAAASTFSVLLLGSLAIRATNARAACNCFGWSRYRTINARHLVVLSLIAGVAWLLSAQTFIPRTRGFSEPSASVPTGLGLVLAAIAVLALAEGEKTVARNAWAWVSSHTLVPDRVSRSRLRSALRRADVVSLMQSSTPHGQPVERWNDGSWVLATYQLDDRDTPSHRLELVLAVSRRLAPFAGSRIAAAVVDYDARRVLRTLTESAVNSQTIEGGGYEAA